MEKTVLLCRTSSEDQAERGTIENQIIFGEKYCDLHQIPLVDIYKDDGVSGTIPLQDRPEGKRLLDDAKEGNVKLVLIYKLDRLGRTARIILNAVHDLEQYGVQVRSMTEPFDTSTPAGRFLLTILAGAADLDRSSTLERLWHGANRAAHKGKWLGGIVPFGYEVIDGFLQINEEPIPGFHMSEAEVVRLIYNLVADKRMSTIKVADYLNSLGVPPSYVVHDRKPKRGKRMESTTGIWYPSRIGNIIKNPTYKGTHEYGKRTKKEREIITRKVPPIVPEEQWNRAQQVLKNNQLFSPRSAKYKYLLRGLIKCGTCGSGFHGMASETFKYYKCNGRDAYHGSLVGKCTSKMIQAEWIEDLVWKDCVQFIMYPGETLAELSAAKEETTERLDIDNEKQILQRAIYDKENETQNILDLFRKKRIELKDLELQLDKINTEKKILEVRINDLEAEAECADQPSQFYDSLTDLLCSLKEHIVDQDPPWEVKREIVSMLVKKVTVHTKYPDGDGPPNNDNKIRLLNKKPKISVSIIYSFSKLLTTRTRIHRREQHHLSRIGQRSIGARYCDLSVLQRLSQHFQCGLGKLRQLIQKQYAVMS